jgi:hypothetical protein
LPEKAELLGLLDEVMGWCHPGRVIQRWIAALLFVIGTIWAVLLICSLFVLVGVLFNVVFMFGWLIYAGWFHVMTAKPMSVSLRFFWMASIAVHGAYGWIFARWGEGNSSSSLFWEDLIETGLAWWIPLWGSVAALACELWVDWQVAKKKRVRMTDAL